MESTASSINVEEIKQTKDNKKDIENKVARILKLIKSNDQDKKGKIPEDSRKKSELIGLIHDFHKQYQSLYAQFDNLKGEMGKRGRPRKERGNSPSSSSSDSDEYYSSEEIEAARHTKSLDLSPASFDAAGLNHLLTSKAAENESLSPRYTTFPGKSPRTRGHERKREHSTLVKVHEVHGSAQIKELEGQLAVLRMELESLRRLKSDLEVKIEGKEAEVRQIGKTNVQLHTRISEFEMVSEEKGNEISAMTMKMQENNNNLTSKIQVLMTQVKNLQMEMDSLRAEKAELEESKRNKISAQAKIMQQEFESFQREKTELQLHLNKKTKEITENLIQIETLKDEIARKTVFEHGLLKEKEGFVVQIEDLKLEVNSLHDQNNELEELIKNRNRDTDELREEKGRLQRRISELECKGNENTTQIMALKAQVNSLQQELDSSPSKKSNSAQNQKQMENEILKEREDSSKKIHSDHKLIKPRSLDSVKSLAIDPSISPKQQPSMKSPKNRSLDSTKLNHHVLERKIDELAEKFHMKMENHIRLLSQRIRVAEQTHVETKESYKEIQVKLEQENKELNVKKANYKSEVKKMKDMLMKEESNIVTGMDLMIRKLDVVNGNFINRISRISSELEFANNWITEKNNEIKKLKHDLQDLTSQLDDKKDEEFLLRERVGKLETELNVVGLEENYKQDVPSQLERRVGDLEQQLKEKDEILSSLGDEKREAIRQLCVLIDYHRNRYDHLKEAVSKMPIKFKKPA